MKRYGSMPLEEAIQKLVDATKVPKAIEKIYLSRALGQILAEDCVAQIDTPPFDRSPLDGYAVRSIDIQGASKENPVTLKVLEKIYAGKVPTQEVTEGTATRIMTGAMLPRGADCVIRQEDTDYGEETVSIYSAVKAYENYVHQGEDTKKGTVIFHKGHSLEAADLALCSSVGIGEVSVYAEPKIALFATGDELSPLGKPLPPGKIYDSNLQFLVARLSELGLHPELSEFLSDDENNIAQELLACKDVYDFVITTGGVSVGEKDLLPSIAEEIGTELIFWGLAMKPGSPALAWKMGNTIVLSLSGNPFASAATFELLARPVLHKLTGGTIPMGYREKAVLVNGFPKASGGRRFIRGMVQNGLVTIPVSHSSGVLRSMVGCNCLVDIPAGTPPLREGTAVEIICI